MLERDVATILTESRTNLAAIYSTAPFYKLKNFSTRAWFSLECVILEDLVSDIYTGCNRNAGTKLNHAYKN